jgi:hypothetical protein
MEAITMTYQELYRASTTWEARHIAQDYYLMYGAEEIASDEDIRKVNRFQIKEGGEPIAPYPSCSGNPTMTDCINRGYCGREYACND